MSGHTPGPWFVEQSEKTPIYVSPVGRHKNISICNVLVMDEDDSESGDWINGDETKANANLIAAAPDLLEALERLTMAARDSNDGYLDPAISHAEDVIARAKGEA